jgi:hypothetical protein
LQKTLEKWSSGGSVFAENKLELASLGKNLTKEYLPPMNAV